MTKAIYKQTAFNVGVFTKITKDKESNVDGE